MIVVQRVHLVEVPLPPVSPLLKLKDLPAALELLEAVLVQNVSMTPMLRYRDMRSQAKAWASCNKHTPFLRAADVRMRCVCFCCMNGMRMR